MSEVTEHDVPEAKSEVAFSKEEIIEQMREGMSSENQITFDRLMGLNQPVEMKFSKEEIIEQVRAGMSPEVQVTFDRCFGLSQPVEQDQEQKPWEPSAGTPGQAAEPQRDRM